MKTHQPVRYLILIDAAGAPTARLYDAERTHILDVDATSEEVSDMTGGHVPRHDASGHEWDAALGNHTLTERRDAQIFALDI